MLRISENTRGAFVRAADDELVIWPYDLPRDSHIQIKHGNKIILDMLTEQLLDTIRFNGWLNYPTGIDCSNEQITCRCFDDPEAAAHYRAMAELDD